MDNLELTQLIGRIAESGKIPSLDELQELIDYARAEIKTTKEAKNLAREANKQQFADLT
jgi:hypothetical protein